MTCHRPMLSLTDGAGGGGADWHSSRYRGVTVHPEGYHLTTAHTDSCPSVSHMADHVLAGIATGLGSWRGLGSVSPSPPGQPRDRRATAALLAPSTESPTRSCPARVGVTGGSTYYRRHDSTQRSEYVIGVLISR